MTRTPFDSLRPLSSTKVGVLHLAYRLALGKVLSLDLFGDVFNVTDSQRAVTVDQIWTRAAPPATADPNECDGPGTGPGTACPAGNPNWGGPLTFQEPRTVRLGAKLAWQPGWA